MVFIKSLVLSSTQVLVIGYVIVILIGTFFLSLPIATAPGERTRIMDAFFTATSATAVTGLVVVDTATHWTFFGKVVIMLLIQIGGFGFMTTSTLVMILLGKRITLKERLIIAEERNTLHLDGIIRLVRYIVVLTLRIEVIGALLLFFRFIFIMGMREAIFKSIFHSVSAFNNAGFDLFGNSMVSFKTDWYVLSVLSGLLIIGGLGFVVISEIYRIQNYNRFSLHTKVVLNTTLFLILIGIGFIFILEYNNPVTAGDLDISGKLAVAFFQGIVPRTAGFNSVPIGEMTKASIFFIILLMFIGASPGSTGGGIKTTTFGTIFAVFWSLMRQRNDVEIFKRRLAYMTIFKAVSVFLIGILVVCGVTMILSITEEYDFLALLFETVSAFGTVGLSTGITSDLSSIGRLMIIFTMFIGRVGPMTLAVAIGARTGRANLHYPEEEMMIG